MKATDRSDRTCRLLLRPTRPLALAAHREYDAIACGEAIARGEGAARRRGPLTAMQVEDSIHRQGWPEGAVCGPEEAIASSFGVGVRLMRQAFRILEARGACRQQRGRGGGLVVLRPSPQAVASALADHLRWSGVTLGQISETRSVFELLAAETSARRGNDSPVLAFVLGCLDAFPGGRGPGPMTSPRSDPEQAAVAVCAAVTEGRPQFRGHLRLADGAAPPASEPSPTPDHNNLAAAVAARIGRSIRHEACQAQERLGSLWELAGAHGVSLSVMIAAVRILEDAGVVTCQTGRIGGVLLRVPNGDGLVGLVHGYLASSSATEAQCVSVCHQLNMRATERVAAERSDKLLVELETIYRQMSNAEGFGVMEAWYALQRVLHDGAGNPALHLITRCLAGYSVRAFADPFAPPAPDLLTHMVESAGALVEGVRLRDADQALAAQRRMRIALDERRRRRPLATAC